MKILFAIQGTGNGHLSRAKDVYPELAKYGDVDVLISGIQADVDFPYPVKYKFHGLSFLFGKQGGIDFVGTARKLKLFKLLKDIKSFPVENYDLVINDFEPISAWACKKKKKECISLSHQAAVLHKDAPKPPRSDFFGKLVLSRYAPVTAAYGFHFKAFADNIFTPVIRRQIREIVPSTNPHYTVYLPSYDDKQLVKNLSNFKDVRWEVFSKHNKEPFTEGNVKVMKIDNDAFIRSMAASSGVLCGAGFEGPAEAMYLGKKLMVIPMHAQYEQMCNAAGAQDMGATVIPELSKRFYTNITHWLNKGKPIKADYPDMTADIVDHIMKKHAPPMYRKEIKVSKSMRKSTSAGE